MKNGRPNVWMAHANLPMAANKTIKPSAVRCSIMIYYRFFIFFWFSTISFFSFTRNLVVVVFFLGSSSSSSPLAGSLKTRKGTIAFHAGLVVLIASSFSVCVCVCVCVCVWVCGWAAFILMDSSDFAFFSVHFFFLFFLFFFFFSGFINVGRIVVLKNKRLPWQPARVRAPLRSCGVRAIDATTGRDWLAKKKRLPVGRRQDLAEQILFGRRFFSLDDTQSGATVDRPSKTRTNSQTIPCFFLSTGFYWVLLGFTGFY